MRGPKSKFSDVACTNTSCPDSGIAGIGNIAGNGIAGIGNIAGNGTYETKNERVRKFVCRTYGKSFTSRSGTVFHDLMTYQDAFILGLKMFLKTFLSEK